MNARGALPAAAVAACFIAGLLAAGLDAARLPHRPAGVPGDAGATGALKALDFWSRSRAYPAADIAPGRIARAAAAARALPKRAWSVPPWRFLGPDNVPGRMISVAIHPQSPNTLYAGSASGGLWRTDLSGTPPVWQRVVTGFPVLGVNAIAFDPFDTSVIYIGTGEVYRYAGTHGGVAVRTTRGSYGMGILKTTDAGATWAKSLDWSYNEERGVERISVSRKNPEIVFAATTEGIYRSGDAGASWALTLPVVMGIDVIADPGDTDLVVASCGNFGSPGAGIYRSSNGGRAWTKVHDIMSGKTMLEMYAAIPVVLYADVCDSTEGAGEFLLSTNFGETWSVRDPNNNAGVQGWYSHFAAVHPLDSSRILRAAVGGVGYADAHSFVHSPTNLDGVYGVDDGGVHFALIAGGADDINDGLATTQFYNGFACSPLDSTKAFGSVQDHFGWGYSGSRTWNPADGDEVGWALYNPLNDSITYYVTREGGVVVRHDGRAGGVSGTSYPAGTGAWNTPIAISAPDTNVLYVAKSIVSKSVDGGMHFSAASPILDGNPCVSIALSPGGPDTVYVGTSPVVTSAHLFRTTNGGTSWTDITGILPDRYPLDLATDPHDGRVVYAAFGGAGTGHLFKTTDAGLDWNDITGALPDVPATAVVVDPYDSRIVYCANDAGVYASTDGGAAWEPFTDGLPEAVITADLVISPANHALRAATHGNGLFERPLLSPVVGSVPPGGTADLFALSQNYPNPFNPAAALTFTLPGRMHALVQVYNAAGECVATLADGIFAPGPHTIRWNAASRPSGVYFCRLTAGTRTAAVKMLLLR